MRHAPTEQFSDQSFPSTPTVFGGTGQNKTFVNHGVGFTSNFQQPAPPKSKKGLFLAIGGILTVLVLGFVGAVGLVIYSLIPAENDPLVKTSPTPLNIVKTPTPRAVPTAMPQVSFTPPVEPTKKGSFTIYANQGWQLSNIDVVPLEEFTTVVEGKIDISGVKTGVSASGVNDAKTKSRRIYPEFPTGALLMRTRYADGKHSNIVATNANGANGSWRNYPDERGKIEFCINDKQPENNTGQFIITKTLTRVPTGKKK